MSDKIDQEMRQQLQDVLQSEFSDDAMKRIKKSVDGIVSELEDDLMYRLQDSMAYNLACYVADMAQRAVEMLLEGNEDQMRRYLSCDKRADSGEYIGYNGRQDGFTMGDKNIARQHPVIHGRLFEQGCIRLRKMIVDAHRDVLVTERILDLEEQVKSLVAQNNKLTDEIERRRQFA